MLCFAKYFSFSVQWWGNITFSPCPYRLSWSFGKSILFKEYRRTHLRFSLFVVLLAPTTMVQVGFGGVCEIEPEDNIFSWNLLILVCHFSTVLKRSIQQEIIGISRLVQTSDLHWLIKRFGKVPPMALPCRMKGG